MAIDVTNPENLQFYVELAESVEITAQREVGLGLKSDGTLPVDGAYVAGIVYATSDDPLEYPEAEIYTTIVTNGIAVGKIAQGVVIAADDPLACNALGELRLGVVGTDSIIGTARDSSTGSPVGVNHYTRVKIERR